MGVERSGRLISQQNFRMVDNRSCNRHTLFLSAGASVAAVSPKSRTRRRKKGDEEEKELFPFYEQSLF